MAHAVREQITVESFNFPHLIVDVNRLFGFAHSILFAMGANFRFWFYRRDNIN